MKTKFLFAAGIALALAFIFSCSGEKEPDCFMQENDDDSITVICGDDYYEYRNTSSGSTLVLISSSSSEEPSSSSTAPISSSSAEQFAFCVYSEWRVCADGPVTQCPGNGVLSNECPDFTLPEFDFCVYRDAEACLPGPLTECYGGGELSNECPFVQDVSEADIPCEADYNDLATFRTRIYYCSKDADNTLRKYGSVRDAKDNKTYKTIVIGEQTWMAENLNYNAQGSACIGDLESNCDIYGRLYSWAAALALPAECDTLHCGNMMVHKEHPVPLKGLCPEGWHIPSKADYSDLLRKVQNDNGLDYPGSHGDTATVAGRELKARSGWKVGNDSYLGLDTYGFTALAGGEYEFFYSNSIYYGHPDYKVAIGYAKPGAPGAGGYLWSYNDTHANYIVKIGMLPSGNAVAFNGSVKPATNEYFYNVRCLKD